MTGTIEQNDGDYTVCTIMELVELYRSKKAKPTRVLEQYIDRVRKYNGPLHQYTEDAIGYNAISQLFGNEFYRQAILADNLFAQYDPEKDQAPPLLCGIPLVLKEIMHVSGWETLNGAPDLFSGNHADRDATVVEKLREQGAVLIGHTIASRLSGDAEGLFAGNAWDLARSPGGSSQGSGVAPMARFCAAALGAETGGSIIHPGAANGASAIKPSSGLISVAGSIPLVVGVDVIGPIARSMQDAAIVMNMLIGVDPEDPLTLTAPRPPLVMPTMPRLGARPLSGIRIGVPQKDWMAVGGSTIKEPPYQSYHENYKEAFDRFKNELTSMGATVIDFDGLDMATDDPYYTNPQTLGTVDTFLYDEPYEMPINPFQAVTIPLLSESHWLDEVEAFANTCPLEQKQKLINNYLFLNRRLAAEGIINKGYRAEGLRQLGVLRNNYLSALSEHNIDFMLVLPLGDHPRYKKLPATLDLPVQRVYKDTPNVMGWPMVTFPIGHATTGGQETPVEMPINAAFWGPRFQDAMLVQTVIDYQDRFAYHKKLPEIRPYER